MTEITIKGTTYRKRGEIWYRVVPQEIRPETLLPLGPREQELIEALAERNQ